MRPWLKSTLAGLVIVLLIGAAVLAESPPSKQPGRQVAGKAAILAQKLGLTPEQGARIRGILAGPSEELERLQKAVKMTRLRLALAVEEGASAERLAASIKDCEAAAKQAREFREAQLRKAFAVLTVEQQAKVILMDREDWWRLLVMPSRPPKR